MPSLLQEKVNNIFEDFQLKRAFIGNSGSKLLGINMLFTDSFFQSRIVLKFNLKGNYQLNKVYNMGNYNVYHFNLNEVPTAIMFKGIDTLSILKIISKLKRIKVSKSDFSLIQKAHASECHNPTLTNGPNLETTIASNSAASMISECFENVGGGAYESTIGTLESIGTGITNEWNTLWSNPTKRMGEYWGFVETGVSKIWDFAKVLGEMLIDPVKAMGVLKQTFGEIGEFFTKVYNNIAGLPLQTKVNMICNIIGSIGIDVLITAVTVGSGGGKLAPTVARVLNKLRKISTLVGKGIKYPFKVLNELSEVVIQKMNKIINSGNKSILDKKIREVGCAI